jgi:hypothetical protein
MVVQRLVSSHLQDGDAQVLMYVHEVPISTKLLMNGQTAYR